MVSKGQHKMESEEIEIDLTKISKVLNSNKTKKFFIFIALALTSLLTYYIRTIPKIYFLQAIDPFYLYRITKTLISNNFVLPSIDVMRYYPTGFSPLKEYYLLYYIYGIIYALFIKPFGINFLTYARFIPVILAASYIPIYYYIAKEIFTENKRITGIFVGFLFAVSNATIFRSSKGFFEKEPMAGLFILLSFLFFLKSQKYNKISDSILAGLFTAIAYGVWGGSIMLLYLYTAYAFLKVLLGEFELGEQKAYLFYAITYLIFHSLLYPSRIWLLINKMILLSVIGIGTLAIIEYKTKWSEKEKRTYCPIIVVAGILSIIVFGFFSSTVSKIISNIFKLIVYRKGVIESTVAENVAADIAYFIQSFGIYPNNIINILSSIWFFAILGSLFILFKDIKAKKNQNKFIVLIFSYILTIVSYYYFLQSSGANTIANLLYVVGAVIVLSILIIDKQKEYALLMLFIYATLLMFVTKVRIAYPTGMFLVFLSAYGLSKITSYIFNNFHYVFPEKIKVQNIVKGVSILVLTLLTLGAIYNNISYAKNIGNALSNGELNELWKDALKYMHENISSNGVILSWWDFGYWFQTLGGKKTLLDGGNQLGYRNVFAAKYFTGRYNRTWDYLYLAAFHPTHILVDYSMIGKYAAMSKIANNGKWIDSYAMLRLYKQLNNYLIYRMPYYKVYVPITKNKTIDLSKGIKIIPSDANTLYLSQAPEIRYLCSPYGVIDLSIFKNKPSNKYIKECLYLIPGYPQIAYLTFTSPNNKAGNKIYKSNFHKLYVENGDTLPYVKKVFDNFYVKIYKINYTYIMKELKKENISNEFINYTLENCADPYKTTVLKKCPLYYDNTDYN